jgi:hypothetical protein
LPKPINTEGHSLVPLLKNPAKERAFPAYSITGYKDKIGRSVRTNEWHYVEWENGSAGSMLFRHPDDPSESKNLANDPQYVPIVSKMKALLKKMP